MIEALWSVKFIVPNNGAYGAGVVVLENGLIRGGDSNYYYLGNFEVRDGGIRASVNIHHYFGPLNNVFGPLTQVEVSLSGGIAYDRFTMTGTAKGLPQTVYVELERIAEISP